MKIGQTAGSIGRRKAPPRNNREINRQFSTFLPKILDLCPNSAIFASEQGINREFRSAIENT
jgi:hypothetical protein